MLVLYNADGWANSVDLDSMAAPLEPSLSTTMINLSMCLVFSREVIQSGVSGN